MSKRHCQLNKGPVSHNGDWKCNLFVGQLYDSPLDGIEEMECPLWKGNLNLDEDNCMACVHTVLHVAACCNKETSPHSPDYEMHMANGGKLQAFRELSTLCYQFPSGKLGTYY